MTAAPSTRHIYMRNTDITNPGALEKFKLNGFFVWSSAKIQIENKKGETCLDIAKAYGNPVIIETIQTLVDSLPPPNDKKKKKKGMK